MKKAIGIDLGTTNTVVAFKDTVVKIMRNKENKELTRSCVGLRKGEIFVGEIAYQLLGADPVNTILSVKRLMGGAIKDEMVFAMKNSSYYKFGITDLKGGTQDAVAVIFGGKQYTPEQISAEILKKVKEDAEEKFGEEVTHAVITVPAYFTEKQKNATIIAAQMAGLKVQKLLAEPTAAAIAYGIENMKAGEAKTVMIYDFGGGTFDLSILNIVDGQYMEAGTGGDRWLGGDDIDRKLQEFVLEKVTLQYKIKDINDLLARLSDKKRFLFESHMRFITESAKIQLSSAKTAQVYIDNILEDENGDIIEIDVTITREEFDAIARPFVERSIDLIGVLLKEVRYDITMIDSILLVGGTSCIPLVKQMLSEKFGIDKVKISEKPMLAIAEGAAILSHRLGDDYVAPLNNENAIEDISYSTNHNYFIELQDKFDRIIEKQIPLPCIASKTYRTSINNQRVVKVGIYADVEDGKMEIQTMGFFTIEEDLPIDSEVTLDIIINIEEQFEVNAYHKTNKAKSKKIVLGRGNKDSKAFEFLSSSFDKVINGDFSQKQRDFFFKSAQKEIEEINKLGNENADNPRWEKVGTNVFAAYEQAERVSEQVDEGEITLVLATILLNEYPDLLDKQDASEMRRLLGEIKSNEDQYQKIQSSQKLKVITEKYFLLITLFTVKMASDKAVKISPTDGHRLLQLHDQIVNHFRNQREEDAFALLDEAIVLRDKYDQGGSTIASIHLKKA